MVSVILFAVVFSILNVIFTVITITVHSRAVAEFLMEEINKRLEEYDEG